VTLSIGSVIGAEAALTLGTAESALVAGLGGKLLLLQPRPRDQSAEMKNLVTRVLHGHEFATVCACRT